MSERIQIRTLTDGGQQPGEIARLVSEFVDGAERSLDLAHYDFALGEQNAARRRRLRCGVRPSEACACASPTTSTTRTRSRCRPRPSPTRC